MVATGSWLLVVTSGHAAVAAVAAVAHVWRWREAVVGVFWLVSSAAVAGIVAGLLPLAIVGVRHTSDTGQLGWWIALWSLSME